MKISFLLFDSVKIFLCVVYTHIRRKTIKYLFKRSDVPLLSGCHVPLLSGSHKFDMICLSETFLDSSTPSNDERLDMKEYKLTRADNPSDSKKSGVGIIKNF